MFFITYNTSIFAINFTGDSMANYMLQDSTNSGNPGFDITKSLDYDFTMNSMGTANHIVVIEHQVLVGLIKCAVNEALTSLGSTAVVMDDELWDLKKTSEFLTISDQTLKKLVKEGTIVAQRSGRKYHFLKSNVLKFLNRHN